MLIEEARRYVGVQEVPRNSNRGMQIDYWALEAIGDVNWSVGTPWCASFVYSMGVQAVGRQNWPLPQTASCQALYDWAKEREMVHVMPLPGDVFLLHYSRTDRYGHTGIVTAVTPGTFDTVEGNTNAGGGREGYGVFERTRPLDHRAVFVRWQ
jgi:hypothetical protein